MSRVLRRVAAEHAEEEAVAELVGDLGVSRVRVGAMTEHDVGAAPERAQFVGRPADVGQRGAFGGAAVEDESVGLVPVEMAARVGGHLAGGA